MVDSRKYFQSTFVTLKDVAEGPMQVTIHSVAEGKYGKLDVTFEEGFALGLNATNTRVLSRAYGPDTDRWIGNKVELFAGEVEYQGKPQASVLVKTISPSTPASLPLSPPPAAKARNADMDDDIPFIEEARAREAARPSRLLRSVPLRIDPHGHHRCRMLAPPADVPVHEHAGQHGDA